VHEAVDIGGAGRLQDVLSDAPDGRRRCCRDRAGEEPGVLQDHADLERRLSRVRSVMSTVEGDPTAIELVEAHDEVDQVVLPAPVGPDDGDRLARLDAEVEVLDERRSGV
jgi:hypothetical protein